MSVSLENAVFFRDAALRDGGTQFIYVEIDNIQYSLRMLGSFKDQDTDDYQKIRITSELSKDGIDQIVRLHEIQGIRDFLFKNKDLISPNILITWESVLNEFSG